ncbi:hypothetical protein C2G38_2177762 [Gigaspora rosea]|uniref:Transmembrane protein n=1 Tax=Gigaspora rosea TaxID=44941 RepID=A0A397VPA9_9GLOM|nr:hypothetical protein C2G38_2177762 [Gigaspora rosea]
MIPRQPRQISFNDELTQTLEKVPPPGILVLLIYTLLVFTTLTLLYFYDIESNYILFYNQNVNNQDINYFGLIIAYLTCSLMALFYPIFEYFKYKKRYGIIFNILGAGFSIPLVYPYLKDQVIGPDNRIIQCDQIYSSGSSQDQWCAYHQRRIILSWLLIFVWFTKFFIYSLLIPLLIVLVILCKRGYKISKLWVVYQYQYRKGLFLTWLKEQKEKSRQQHIESVTINNVKNDKANKEINIVEIVIIG